MRFYMAMKEEFISFSESVLETVVLALGRKKPRGGCSGFSILRGTLKLPKAFSRLVPLCQRYLCCQKVVSQPWKM